MAQKKAPRRSSEETYKLYLQAEKLVEGGMSKSDACEKVGIVSSVFHGHRKKLGITGSINASMLPPRPVHGNNKGKKATGPWSLDMNDVGSIARRISIVDRKISAFDALKKERRMLADRLMELLKTDGV